MSTFESNTPIDNSNKESEPEIKIPFWSNDPNILFRSEYIFEFFPVEHMTYEQKLNAVSRGIILIAILTFLFSRSIRILVVSAITLFAIFMLYFYQQREKDKSSKLIEETFANQANDVLKKYSISKDNVFDEPTSSNPFGNVLVTDYEYNPEKKPAPPSFNSNINDNILKQAKQLVSELNPDQPDISDKLFKDLGEQYVFEQSLRQFSSNPSTTIPNDQTGFAEFCYGSMVSCKEGNLFACARNLDRYTNY
jgi:hypothetical protein